MKILFLAHRLPYPPNKGDKIRSFHMLKYLAKSHQVSLACPIDADEDVQFVPEIQQYCETIDWVRVNTKKKKILSVKALFSNKPLSVECFYSRKLQLKIDQRLNETKFDVIYAFSSQMAAYVQDANNSKRIMDFVDIDSYKWRQYSNFVKNPISKLIYRWESKKLACYEKEIAQKFNASIFVSDAEAQKFKNTIHNDDNVFAVHNGVDYDYFNPNGRMVQKNKFPIILFTGAMDYYPNIDAVTWFVKEIFPTIKTAIPDVKFYIVGNKPNEKVKKLHDNENIIVTGFVEDVRDYFNMADVFVAPFRIACGVQNKILEALAMSVPAVASPIGAEGIKNDNPIHVAAEPNDFTSQVIGFLKDRNKNNDRLRRWVMNNYSWERNLTTLENLLIN